MWPAECSLSIGCLEKVRTSICLDMAQSEQVLFPHLCCAWVASWPVGSSPAFWTTVMVLTYRMGALLSWLCFRKHLYSLVVCTCWAFPTFSPFKVCFSRTSLVAQRLRISLPMQGTGFQFLVWEILHAAKQLTHGGHNYWPDTRAWEPQPPRPRACAPQQEATAVRSLCALPCRAASSTYHN